MSTSWDLPPADVVVVGMGAAGLAAAIEAHDAGAAVLVVEKAPPARSGGNSRVSGQVWFSPLDVSAAQLHLRSLSGDYPIPAPIVEAWAQETARNNDWVLARATEVKGRVPRDAGDPFPASAADVVRVSYQEIRSYAEADPPPFEFPELEGNECGTEYNMLGGTMGFSRLWLTLRECLRDRGIAVRYATRGRGLQRTPDGQVSGVVAEDGSDRPVLIPARRGVVVTSGGFAGNPDMGRNHLRLSAITPWGSPFNTGDGIVLGQQAGADLAHPYNYMASPGIGIAMPPYESGEDALPREHRFIAVGADGRRFTDETVVSRHGKARVRGTLDFHPGVPMWVVFDEDGRLAGPLVPPRDRFAVGWLKQVEGYSWSGDNAVEIERGWIIRADSLEELAEKLGVDGPGLAREVAEHNAAVESGLGDMRFGRPVATMSRIARPPFYGYAWGQVLITTLGGLCKDERARVLTPAGTPIERLYAAGDAASTYSWALGGGMALGDALAFGRIAGREAAALPSR